MMDVFTVLYEADITPKVEDDLKIRSKIRSAMWDHLFNKRYPYPFREEGDFKANDFVPPDALPDDSVEPSALPPKEFIEPTDPAEFEGAGLDAPMGG